MDTRKLKTFNMKNILFLLLFFCLVQTKAQTIIPSEDYFNHNAENNVYFKDVNHIYDKFLGTWIFSEGPHYLKIIVKKLPKVEDGVLTTGERVKTRLQYNDLINVEYQYKYNGVEVYHVLYPYRLVSGKLLYSSIIGSVIMNPNQLLLYYDEPSTTTCIRNRVGELNLTYLDNNTLHWVRTDKKTDNPESFCTTGSFDVSEYKIPADIVLTKQ